MFRRQLPKQTMVLPMTPLIHQRKTLWKRSLDIRLNIIV